MWIKSAEFAVKFGLNKKSLEKSCFRAEKAGKKFCTLKSNILVFSHAHGVGGKSGQVLQIWDEGFDSEADAVAFLGRGSTIANSARLGAAQNGGVSAAVDCFGANAPRNDEIIGKKSAAVCVDSSLAGVDEDSNLIVAVSKNLHRQALDSFDSGKNEIANTAPTEHGLRTAEHGNLAVVDIISTPNLTHPQTAGAREGLYRLPH